MKRRILLFALCLSMLMPALRVFARQEIQPAAEQTVAPETTKPDNRALSNLQAQLDEHVDTEDQRIRQQIMRIHSISLRSTGYSSLAGRCGLQVSWELYLLGINKILKTYDGNNHYDAYKDLEQTTGGYVPKAYDVKDYSLEEALNTISRHGTLDVYNIMVGFQRTNTVAGRKYGHVCFIHAILGGMVYFVEGFATRFGTAEGEPIVVTIEEFAEYFAPWTQYEGTIHFGTGNLLDSHTYHPSDMFAQCLSDTAILTVPELESSALLRTAQMGERLRVTGLYEDMGGTYYYQIDDDGTIGYVNAQALKPVRFNYEDVQYTDPVLPQAMKEGQTFQTGGKIATEHTQLGAIRVLVTDPDGEIILEYEILKDGNMCDLDARAVRGSIELEVLPEGGYIYSVYADVLNNYLDDGKVVTDSQRICLATTGFTVGQAQQPQAELVKVKEEPPTDGWYYKGGKWYCYENGAPRVGWFCQEGQDYYTDETGAAAVGWAQINGQWRYFSSTGAMRVGWLRTYEGARYMLRNGVIGTGWRTVDGVKYCFDENGIMLCGGWTELEGKLFYFFADGKTATGWVTLDSGTYSFHADGYLLARKEEQDGQTQVIEYDGTWKPSEADQNQLTEEPTTEE